MAIFSITINEKNNLPPNQLGAYTIQLDAGVLEHTITLDELTVLSSPPYSDPEGDPLNSIKIIDINPDNKGRFLRSGIEISVNTVIEKSEIIEGAFTYLGEFYDEEYSDYFFYDASDEGSLQFGGLKGFYQVNYRPLKNLPPIIGDGEETIDYGDSLVFTKAMFVDDTHPSYFDPEGDAPYRLRIDTLPLKGYIEFEGVPIVEGDEFSFVDIELGKLIYNQDLSATTTQDIEFEFSVSDTGSQEFGS